MGGLRLGHTQWHKDKGFISFCITDTTSHLPQTDEIDHQYHQIPPSRGKTSNIIKMVGCCVFLPSGSGNRWWWMGGGCNFAPHLNSKTKGLVISESLKLGKEANKLLIRRHFMLKADRQANDQITCKQTSKTKAEQWKQKCK